MRKMIRIAALAVFAMTSISMAADGPPPAAQAAPKIKLELGMDTLNVIAKGLAELPLKEAAPVLNEINAQIQKELPAPEPAKAKK